MIDIYLTELGAALRGPRRAKANLLAEARDHLLDATESYERGGLPRAAAEQAAIADFGAIEELVPDYQAELGWTQGRRTALAVLFVFLAQPFFWDHAYRRLTGRSSELPYTADEIVENLGGATILLALLVVLAYRTGMRYPAVRAGLTRLTGVVALVTCTLLAAASMLLTALSGSSPLWMTAFALAPASWLAVSARRCLTT